MKVLCFLALALHCASADRGRGRDWDGDGSRELEGGPREGCQQQQVSLNVMPSAQVVANNAMNITCTFDRIIPRFLYLVQTGVVEQTLAEVNPFQAVVIILQTLVSRVSVLIDFQQKTVTFIYSSTVVTDSGKYQCFGPRNDKSNQVDVTVAGPEIMNVAFVPSSSPTTSMSPSTSTSSAISASRSTVKATVVVSSSSDSEMQTSDSKIVYTTPKATYLRKENASSSNASFAAVHSPYFTQQAMQIATIVVPPLCAILLVAIALLCYVYRCRASATSTTVIAKEKAAAMAPSKLKFFKDKQASSKYVHFENEESENPIDNPPPSYNQIVSAADQLPPTYDATRGVV